MKHFYNRLQSDIRFDEGLRACINCGTCTAICPAAAFYNYDPKKIVTSVQTADDAVIGDLLKSETIWYCGECMSCKTRCPRGNTPGLIIMALRRLSIETGLFVESEKGRQMLALKRILGHSILTTGYCVHIENMDHSLHPEQGPIWAWSRKNAKSLYNRLGGNFGEEGPGAMRRISKEDLKELNSIFEVTQAFKRFDYIENYSALKAGSMGYTLTNDKNDQYFQMVYKTDSRKHSKRS